jgi:MFS family permease
VGPRKPLMLASFMIAAGGVIAGVWQDLLALFLICPLMGTFNSMFQMATHQTVGRYGKPEDRPANFSLQSLGISAATFAGPMVAGLAIDHLGFSDSFLLLAAIGFIPMVVISLGVLHFPPKPQTKRDAAGSSPAGWALLRDRELRRAYIVATMNNGVWSIVNFLIPLYGTQIGLSATRIGSLMAFLSGGTVAIRFFTSMLVRRFKPWPLVVVSQAMIGIGFFGMPFTAIYALLAVLACVMGIGLGLSGPLSTSLMYDASPPDRVGEVIGLRMTMANAAQAVVPLLFGAVGTALGVAPVFWAVSAVLFGDVWSSRSKLR